MRTYSLLKGLSIYEVCSGTKIGDIFDICISETGLVKGVLLKKGALLKKTFLIETKDVTSFGWDGIMVEDVSVLQPIQVANEYTFESRNRLTGKMIMTKEGERLGILDDVYFMENMGTIVGYEISDGFFSDMLEGKKVIKTDEPPAIGKDAIIVNVK